MTRAGQEEVDKRDSIRNEESSVGQARTALARAGSLKSLYRVHEKIHLSRADIELLLSKDL